MNQKRTFAKKSTTFVATLLSATMILFLMAAPIWSQTVTTEESTETEYNVAGFLINTKISLGLLNGESHEIVYAPQYNWKVSELIWEIDTVYMLGGEISIRPLPWLGLNMEGWVALNEGDGAMDDYDWLYLGYDEWSHWSHHEKTDLTKGTMFDFGAEFFALRKPQFSLSFLVGYKTNNWKWESYGGTYTYSVNGFRDQSGVWSDDDLAITYEQWFDVPYIGVGMTAQAGPVELRGRIIGSNQVEAEDEDHHHWRNLIFEEDFEGGDFIGIQLGATYNITPNLGIALDIDYQDYAEIKGDTTVTDTITGAVEYYGGDSAGIDNELTLISLGVTYRF